MANYVAVTRSQHQGLRWKRFESYHFAGTDALAPLVVQELPRACMHLPIGFTVQGQAYMPVGLLGLATGHNLLVGADGRWVGGYVPACYRSYPFALGTNADTGEQVLCVDTDSGLVNEFSGEAFFQEDGTPAPAVQEVLGFLTQVQQNRQATARVCQALQAANVIQPWPLSVPGPEGEARVVNGLFRIDEAALNALPAADFEALRRAGALPVAYCQLLSMQHLAHLQALHRQHQQSDDWLSVPAGELDLEFLNDDTIKFG